MNKKSKKTLKNAFNIPEPNRKEQFFNSFETRQQKKLPAHIPMYVSAVATAVLVIGVWSGVKNLPYFSQPEVTDNPVYNEQTSSMESSEQNNIQITSLSSIIKNTVRTSVASTATEKNTGHSGTVTTVTEKTTVPETEDNAVSSKTIGSQTTENLNYMDENNHTTTEQASFSYTTTTKTNSQTTATNTISATTSKQNNEHSYTTTSARTTVTTTKYTSNTTESATTVEYEYTQSVTTVASVPSEYVTTVATNDENNSTDVPKPIETDFTVKPLVQYYPSGNTVDIRDILNDDVIPPATSSPGNIPTNTETNIKDLIGNSSLIVLATVDEVIYTGVDGKPYTQENITVLNTLSGYMPVGAKISVYSRGGYIPASEYSPDMYIDLEKLIENDTVIFDPALNHTTPQINDTRIYLLSRSTSNLPDGSYSLVTLDDISKFRLDDGFYINIHDENIILSPKEFHDYLYN